MRQSIRAARFPTVPIVTDLFHPGPPRGSDSLIYDAPTLQDQRESAATTVTGEDEVQAIEEKEETPGRSKCDKG